MGRIEVLAYLKQYWKDACSIGNLYLRAYTLFAVERVVEEIQKNKDKNPVDVVEKLTEQFDEFAAMAGVDGTAMFSCARDTMIDIYDHIIYPREYPDRHLEWKYRQEK